MLSVLYISFFMQLLAGIVKKKAFGEYILKVPGKTKAITPQ